MKSITFFILVSCTLVNCTKGMLGSTSTPFAEMRAHSFLDSLHWKYYREYHFDSDNAIAYANRPLEYFRLGKYSLATNIDSVYTEFGPPLAARKASWFDGDAGKLYFYPGIYFQYAFDSSSCVRIRTIRTDLTTPDGIHCGMTFNDLKLKLHDVSFRDEKSGLVIVSTPEGFEYIIIYLLNRKIIGICLETGAG